MKYLFSILLWLGWSNQLSAQYSYQASSDFPYGRLNPAAPQPLADYAALIGQCQCQSTSRNADGNWGDPVEMTWMFKYIMNGMAVQDETLKADGTHSGSIRQFNPATEKWYVHYFSSALARPTLQSWEGDPAKENEIVLYSPQKAPSGDDGFYKIVFSNISKAGFDWLGAWTNPEETINYPLWKITCKKDQP